MTQLKDYPKAQLTQDADRGGAPDGLTENVAFLRQSHRLRVESTMSLVLFVGYDANVNRGLWVSDGTAGGTHELSAKAAKVRESSPS
jgi:ELWxxDGT repeat protein